MGKKFRRLLRRYLAKIQQPTGTLTAIVTGTTIAIVAINAAGIFQFLEWKIQARLLRWRPTEPKSERIVIVTIDETDIEQAQQWPMSDATLTQLIEKVKQQQPRLIGLDIYRNLPVEPGYERLIRVFEQTPNLIAIEKATGERINPPPSLPPEQTAFADVVLDSDGKLRRGLLTGYANDQLKFSLSMKLALDYLEVEGIKPKTVNGTTYLGKARLTTPLRPKWGSYGPEEMGGYQVLLNYRGDRDNFYTISMRDVLADRIPPDLMRDRIVFIGLTAHSLKDFFLTPYSERRMSGVIIHANLTSQILSVALDNRLQLSFSSQFFDCLWILFWSGWGTASCWILFRKNLFRYPWDFLETLSCIVGGGLFLFGTTYLVFITQGWILPVFPPLLALSVGAILTTNYDYLWKLEIKVKERTRELEKAKIEAEAASLAKTKFLANMTHELRTPLNGILGYAQVLESTPGIPSQSQHPIQSISKCSHHLLTLINDILDFSKSETQRLELHPTEMNLSGLLSDVIELCQMNARTKSLTFIRSISELPEGVWIDGKRLRQVLINLLSNAMKFTSVGSVTFTVTVDKFDDGAEALTINFEVTDTGVGIPPEQMEKIFLPFEQGDEPTNCHKGTGLGLSISQKIVEQMGSQLKVRSVLGKGSTFFFTVTVPTTQPVNQVKEPQEPIQATANLSRYSSCPKFNVTIPSSEFQRLHQALSVGDFQEIETIVTSWKKAFPQSETFSDRLLILLESYQLDEIERLIENDFLEAVND